MRTLPLDPAVNTAAGAEVNAGGALIVSGSLAPLSGAAALLAYTRKEYRPPVPAPGVPDKVALPSPSSCQTTPAGSEPLSRMELTAGVPVAFTVQLNATPTWALQPSDEVKTGEASIGTTSCSGPPAASLVSPE